MGYQTGVDDDSDQTGTLSYDNLMVYPDFYSMHVRHAHATTKPAHLISTTQITWCLEMCDLIKYVGWLNIW